MKKLFNQIFDYLKGVANPNNNFVEARLFIAMTAFGYVLIACFVDLFSPLHPSDFIFYTMVGLVTACLGIDALIAGKGIDAKKGLASDVVEKNGKEVIKEAKEILQSDKP